MARTTVAAWGIRSARPEPNPRGVSHGRHFLDESTGRRRGRLVRAGSVEVQDPQPAPDHARLELPPASDRTSHHRRARGQAFTLADRHRRAFLRLVQAMRDLRRLAGPAIVTGGQINIGEQQVNLSGPTGEGG